MTRPAPVLVVDGVRKQFRDVVAVESVSFSVQDGEVFGLLGPNGAGKTTLIRMILDIYRPDSGTVSVFGHRLHRDDLDSIGYLPEERGLYQRRKVIQILTYLGELKGLSRAAARASGEGLLDELGIPEHRDKLLNQLSKGNQQKIQLACTLVASPKLLVWDEPFSGLDPVNVARVRELIRSRRDAGTTIVLSTHLMNQAEALCDRVGLVHKGRLVLEGPVGELRNSAGPPALEVDTDAAIDDSWEGVDSVVVRPVDNGPALPEGLRSLLVCLSAGAAHEPLLRQLLERGARVDNLRRHRPSLEEVFLHAVGG